MNNSLKKAIIAFLLIFLTFGIGSTVYIYILSDKMKSDSENRIIYPVREAVLNLITFGIYGIIWTYRYSYMIDSAEGCTEFTAYTLLCTVLSCFPLRSVSMAVLVYRQAETEENKEVYGDNQ